MHVFPTAGAGPVHVRFRFYLWYVSVHAQLLHGGSSPAGARFQAGCELLLVLPMQVVPTSHCTISTLRLDDCDCDDADKGPDKEGSKGREGTADGAISSAVAACADANTAGADIAAGPTHELATASATISPDAEVQPSTSGALAGAAPPPPLQKLRRLLCVVPAGVPQLVLPNHPVAADAGLTVFAAKDFRTMQVQRLQYKYILHHIFLP